MTNTDTLLVAAIDFGTTYSGFAFSFRHEYADNSMNIYTNTSWIASGTALMSLKTPTTLLLNPDKTFNSFGYLAEDEYMSLVDNNEHEGYYYYKRFKMLLHNKDVLDRNVTIPDVNGRELPAKLVFSMSIHYLVDHLMKTVKNRDLGITVHDIMFVLTIPAIWTEPAKQFMREAAVDAGIPSRNLMFALEPEAASLFCKNQPLERVDTGSPCDTAIVPFRPDTVYMVLDLGGGTVDVTVHKVTKDDTLKEVYKASGGAWGGIKVDAAFHDILKDIVKDESYDKFCKEKRPYLLDVEREFESQKRNVKLAGHEDTKRRISMNLPVELLTTYEELTHKNRDQALSESKFDGKIRFQRGKMQFEPGIFHDMFKDCISSIISHIHMIMKRPEVETLDAIVMVGGFSEANIIVQAIRETFSDIRVVVPPDAGLAVVKGAVLYGHKPSDISSRMCKFTYGVAARAKFQTGHHPDTSKEVVGGVAYCNNVFSKFVEIGQDLDVGHRIERTYGIASKRAPLEIQIYASREQSPFMANDSGCFRLGNILIKPPETGWPDGTQIKVSMSFGGTEFTVTACDAANPRSEYTTSFDFLAGV